MVFTDNGRRFAAIRLGSDIPSISYFAIGSGSGTALVGNTTLVSERAKFLQTGSPNFVTNQKVTFTGDRNSTQMSGTLLTEFGLFQSGAANTGSIWAREAFPSVTFDGTNEARYIYTINVV